MAREDLHRHSRQKLGGMTYTNVTTLVDSIAWLQKPILNLSQSFNWGEFKTCRTG